MSATETGRPSGVAVQWMMISVILRVIGAAGGVFVDVVVVDAEEGSGEGEDFTEGDEYGVVDFSGGRYDEACYEEGASEQYEEDCGHELNCGFVFFDVHFWRDGCCVFGDFDVSLPLYEQSLVR